MQILSSRFHVATALVLAAASALSCYAQAPTSGPTSTVVYVGGDDLVVKAADGKLLNYTVAAGTRFSAGGKDVALTDLKPGTKLTKPVATGFDPKLVAGVQVVKAKVFAATPPGNVTLALAEGTKELTVPAGTKFMVDGKPVTVGELKPNMTVEATIVTTAGEDAVAAAAPATPPMSGSLLVANTAAEGGDLPAAGTKLPLFGVLGLSLLLAGFGLMNFRKPAAAARTPF